MAAPRLSITISCSGGVSRPLQLAGLFDEAGELERLYVPFYGAKHPMLARYLRERGEAQTIDPARVATDLWGATYRKLLVKTPLGRLGGIDSEVAWRATLDRRVSRRLGPNLRKAGAGPDGRASNAPGAVVLVESMIALETLHEARRLGVPAVLDRTNSHIVYQQDLVNEEYRSLGMVERRWHSDAVIARGLAEYQEADRIVTLSSFARRSFLEKGFDAERVLLVPSGADLAAFSPGAKRDEVFRVIYCGAAAVKKGTHYLLEAFERLALPRAELWLIGPVFEEMRPVLSRYEGSFTLKGVVAHDRLADLYRAGSVYVQPSLEEGLAKVILEAMACGLPVVATTNTGAEDVVREGLDGFVVPIRDPDAIADRLSRLAEDQNLQRRMGASAADRVAQGFSWHDYGDRMRAALAGVVEASGR